MRGRWDEGKDGRGKADNEERGKWVERKEEEEDERGKGRQEGGYAKGWELKERWDEGGRCS